GVVGACTPRWEAAPASLRAQLDEQGNLRKRPNSPPSVMDGLVQLFDGAVSPDGYTVNTMQPPYQPSGVAPAPDGNLDLADSAGNPLPPQSEKTIGDTLSARNVSWAWYGGGWNAAAAGGRRRDRRARRGPARCEGKARRDLLARSGRARLPAASPAVQLFRALRAGHRRARHASEGWRRFPRRYRQRHTAAGRVLQARRAQ